VPSASAISPRRFRACALGVSFESCATSDADWSWGTSWGTHTMSGGTTFSNEAERCSTFGGTSDFPVVPPKARSEPRGAAEAFSLSRPPKAPLLLMVLLLCPWLLDLATPCCATATAASEKVPWYCAWPSTMISRARLLPTGVVRGSSPPSSITCRVQYAAHRQPSDAFSSSTLRSHSTWLLRQCLRTPARVKRTRGA